MHFANVTLG